MLDVIRRKEGSWVVKGIFLLLAASFVVGLGLLYAGAKSGPQGGLIVASVDGRNITTRDLDRAYAQIFRSYQEQLGDQLNEEMVKQLNLKFQALNMLVNRAVMLREAERLGFVASDVELRDRIAEIPAFQNAAGQFDPALYKEVLKRQRPAVTPAEFENEMRDQILIGKLERFVRSSVHLTEDEVLAEYLLDKREVDVYVLKFAPTALEPYVKVTDKELRARYDERPGDYTLGPRAAVRIARFPLQQWAQEITIAEDQARAYYEEHADEFRTLDEVQARHILIKTDPQVPESVTAAEAAIRSIEKRVRGGEDFAAVAAAESQDPGSAPRGGDLGWFARGRMVKEFEEAAFGAKPGEIVGPVRTQFGFHLIQVQDKRAAGQRSFENARAEISLKLAQEQALARAQAAANDMQAKLAAGGDFAELAQAAGADVQEEWLAQNDPRAKLKVPPEIFDAVFSANDPVGTEGRRVDVQGRPFLVQVRERAAPQPQPFADVEGRIRRQLIQERAVALAAERAAEAAAALHRGATPAEVARRFRVDVESTGMINQRVEEMPVVGKAPEVLAAAFALTREDPAPKSAFRVGDVYYVLRLKERRDPDPQAYRAERAQLFSELLDKKQDKAWEGWVRAAKSEAQVKLENPPADLLPKS